MKSSNITPVARSLKFHLPVQRIHDWHGSGTHITAFFNVLSTFFPEGELFFIDSVRAYKHEIVGEGLKAQVTQFIGQEYFHTREHEEYNLALRAGGLPVVRQEAIILGLLNAVRRLPRWFQLGGTVGLEHLTAVLGHTLLLDVEQGRMECAEPHYAALWKWHALEETEHKAVSFDVYQQVVGTGLKAYIMRVATFLLANLIFWPMLYAYFAVNCWKAGCFFDLFGWFKVMWFQWGPNGVMTRVAPLFLDFFRPSFHPWDHDNRRYLDWIPSMIKEVEALQPVAEGSKAGAVSAAASHTASAVPSSVSGSSAAAERKHAHAD